MDLEFSPSILDTPSLNTPNIGANPLIFKSSYTTTMINDDNNTSMTRTTTNNESLPILAAEIKVSKIEHDLKQIFTQPRRPTESPFQKIVEAGVKNVSIPLTTDDGTPYEIPSTAEVMNVIESFSKNLVKDNNERESTITGENNRLDTSPPPQTMGVNVSPKKKLLIRSQSHTEPTSPHPPNDENPMEDNHFQRLQDMPIIDSNTQIDMHIKPSYPVQPPIILTNKRTYQQMNIPTNPISIPQHEVTSSNQLIGMKRARTIPMPTNTVNVRSSTTNDYAGSDDHRKKQIRDSNREAARRCRERRRHYIEQLEGNLEQCKIQMKQLNEKLSRAERENTQLRTILTEAKMYHSSSRLSSTSNESLIDFANVISTTNGIELNSETNERNFINRNPH
jgi:hypothetical protein